ncbi:MAG: ATP-binding protein, partial [Candidatus Anammoxibacter sp.]
MKLRLLIIENDTSDAEQIGHELESVLSEYECSIIIAHSGNEALQMINDDRPEIIILNYYLNDTSGEDILKIIKNEYPFIIVVVMTSEGDRNVAIDVVKLGADGYVSKKYGFDGIAYAIQNVVLRKIAEVEVDNLQTRISEDSIDRKIQQEKAIEEATKSLEERNKKFGKIVEVGKLLSSPRLLDDLLSNIISETTDVLEADRTSLFMYDEKKDELWSKIAEKSVMKEIRVSLDKGIVGYVARTRKVLNIEDAYNNELFNPAFDKKTGFRKKNILCAPLETKRGKLIGVIEVINKKKIKSFGNEDEELIRTFASLVTVVIENAILTEEALKRERMATIGDMASTIVHDLKNPMTTIKGYAQIIAVKSPDLIKPANIIVGEIDRLTDMAQDLLDFSKGKEDDIKVEKVKCKEYFKEILEFLGNDFKKRSIGFNSSIRFSGEFEIDKDKIRRAIFNIAVNARDAMEDGGSFNVDVSESEDKKDVVIVISDTGKGMPPDIKDNIFEAFVTHGKRNGTGLGMAITKKIIDSHKGTINVESEEGKGTKFEIVLAKVQ